MIYVLLFCLTRVIMVLLLRAARVAYGLRDYFGATRISRVNARRRGATTSFECAAVFAHRVA